jgi:two-component system OmpR family response regulator
MNDRANDFIKSGHKDGMRLLDHEHTTRALQRDAGRQMMPVQRDASLIEPKQEALQVMLVEDSHIISDLISENLARIPNLRLLGIAETETEALSMLQAQPCDVLILDIQLRQGNGINLLRVLSADPAYANTIKIVLSNHVSGTYRRICEQYGVQFFFDKTSEFPQLQLLLSRLSQTGIDR